MSPDSHFPAGLSSAATTNRSSVDEVSTRWPLVIDCRRCAREGSDACPGCVVTFICSREPDEAVIIDVAEERALRALADGGLLPGLLHQPRTG
jgi:hypothetical protein